MLNFLHNYLPNPIILELGVIKIHWYGLLIAVAVFICLWLIGKLAKQKNIDENHLINLSFYLIIFGIIGARLWHILFYNFHYFISYPWAVFKVWQGGLAIHGSIVAGLLVIYFYTKKHNLKFLRLTDLLVVVLPLGQAIGRWGNYFNQELFGKACNYSWCIPINNLPNQFFHPVFLYESVLNLLLFVGLLLIYRSNKEWLGLTTFIYLAGYSVIRFLMEFLRLDVSLSFYGLNWVQWLCLVIILSVGIFGGLKYKFKNSMKK